MLRQPQISTRTDTLFLFSTLFRSAHFTRCSTTISLTWSERRPPIGFISMRSLKTCAQTMPQAAYSKWNNLRIAFALKPTRIDGTVQDRTDKSTWADVGHAEARSRAVVPQSATNLCFQRDRTGGV